ncbi:elongation of very long chain fatty acids protein-like [Glossina fuscipes]|uniref:Elongation of very long chain fatty acids protein n=1 Tax=Glossina fuscipes TaxID=7396 RepID=A0A8U0WHN0_9MUSC|nr:elongation of very long chain fatty acids protein-like [Glossina fuscipes]
MSIENATETGIWDFLFTELADKRTNDWFLIKSPLPLCAIMLCYLYFVLSWGPRIMRDRKPFRLEKILIVYNALQVAVSVWLVYEYCAIWRHCNWRCQPVDYSTSYKFYREARVGYVYFLAKISELLDTVFFVLRKNERQITFLHVYHHTVMPVISYGALKYYPGGHGMFIGWINSFVHIVMYCYYLLSSFGPKMQKYLWWKKYITNLQMIQFGIVFLHQTQLLYNDCDFPRWSAAFTLPNAVFFYFLFNNFYQQSYSNRKNKNDKLKTEEQHSSTIMDKYENNNEKCQQNSNDTAIVLYNKKVS